MTNKNASVTATKLKDIRDKEQLYLIIENENHKVIINVGEKTFNAVERLIKNIKTEVTNEKTKERDAGLTPIANIGEDILPESIIKESGFQTIKNKKDEKGGKPNQINVDKQKPIHRYRNGRTTRKKTNKKPRLHNNKNNKICKKK